MAGHGAVDPRCGVEGFAHQTETLDDFDSTEQLSKTVHTRRSYMKKLSSITYLQAVLDFTSKSSHDNSEASSTFVLCLD